MRIRDLWIAALVLALVAAYFAYARRAWIETRAWHWRNGYSFRVAPYTVPVPSDWLPRDVGPSTGLFMVRIPASAAGVTTVSVWVEAGNPRDLPFWRSFEEESFRKMGLRSVEEHSFDLNGESLLCIGGDLLPDLAAKIRKPFYFHTKSFVCTSSGNLMVMVNSPPSELADVFALISQIHR